MSAIYAAYEGPNANGISLATESEIRRYFAPAFAQRIIADRKDLSRHTGRTGLVDPFVDASDWRIAAIVIDVTYVGSRQASATVTFRNRDDLSDLLIDMVKIDNDWRIAAITRRDLMHRIHCDCEYRRGPNRGTVHGNRDEKPSFTLGR